jgi:hypothetical protein
MRVFRPTKFDEPDAHVMVSWAGGEEAARWKVDAPFISR